MPTYSASAQKAGVNAANTVMWALRTPASGRRATLRQLAIWCLTAPTAAPVFGISRASTPQTGSTAAAGLPHDPADAVTSSAALDSAWATPPTVTASYFDQIPLPLTVGAGVIWTPPAPIIVPVGLANLLVTNLIAAGTTLGNFACRATWDE